MKHDMFRSLIVNKVYDDDDSPLWIEIRETLTYRYFPNIGNFSSYPPSE